MLTPDWTSDIPESRKVILPWTSALHNDWTWADSMGVRSEASEDTPVLRLSEEQLTRARWLWFSSDRIATFERVTALCGWVVREITAENWRFQNAVSYLNETILKAIFEKKSPTIDDSSIPKWEIKQLIDYMFSAEHIEYGIPYLMPFFAQFINPEFDEQTLNIRILTGLLDFWRKIGVADPRFGKIPPKSRDGISIFIAYTAYRESGSLYFSVPMIEGNRVFFQDYDIPPTEYIPDTFAHIGMHFWSDKDIRIDAGHYETLYVLGGTVYRHLRPSIKWLRMFIAGHSDFLSQNWNIPWIGLKTWEEWVWQWAARLWANRAWTAAPPIIQPPRARWKIERQTTKGNVPQWAWINQWISLPDAWGLTPESTTRQWAWINQWISLPDTWELSPEMLRFPKPLLKKNLSYLIQTGAANGAPPEKLIENPQENAVLWVGIKKWDTIVWGKLDGAESLTLTKPTEQTTFVFCFTENNPNLATSPEDLERYPRTEITIIPRLAPSPPPPNTIAKVAKGVQWAVSNQIPPPSPAAKSSIGSPADKTDDIVLEIMWFFDDPDNHPLTISLSTRVDGTIVGTLSTDPMISFEITIVDTIIFWPKDIIGVNIATLQTHLRTYLPQIIGQARSRIEEKRQREINALLLRLSWASRFIAHCRELFLEGEHGRNSISELAEECEINWNYSWWILVNPLNEWKLEAFQDILKQKWISLKLICISEWWYDHKMRICLADDDQTVYDVSRSHHAPYYHIQKTGPDQDVQVSGFMRALALDTYIVLGRAGLQIYKTKHTPKWSSSWLSLSTIESILDGTYEKPKRTFGSLEESEKRLIAQAAKRLKALADTTWVKKIGLRTLKQEDPNLSPWIILWSISTVKNIGDFYALNEDDTIILTDEKLSCLPQERTRGRIEKWKEKNKWKEMSISDHPYKEEYNLLKHHPRFRKYWVQRMVASAQTIAAKSRCRYLGLAPFANEMMIYFWKFWDGLSDDKKREFLIAAANGWTGKPSKALSVLWDDGENLFDSFISWAEKSYIPITYSKPKILTKWEILEFIQSEDYKTWSAKIQVWIDPPEEDFLEVDTPEGDILKEDDR